MVQKARKKDTACYSEVGRILQLTVLNLQTKKPICKRRTVICTKLHRLNILYLVSLPFAPSLNLTYHLDREVFDLLVIMEVLGTQGLSLANIRASNMSSERCGAQAEIKKHSPLAVYMHIAVQAMN